MRLFLLLSLLLLCSACTEFDSGAFTQGFADGMNRQQAINSGAYNYNTYLLEQQLKESREAAERQRKQLEEMKEQMEALERQRRHDNLMRSIHPYYPY